jgi:hypothetical protein
MELHPTDILPAFGFILAYNMFSILTKHIALLWFFNKNRITKELLLASIAFDVICHGNGWLACGTYMFAATVHLGSYSLNSPPELAATAYCTALAIIDPILAIDLAVLWWVGIAQDKTYKNAILFLALRRLSYQQNYLYKQ